MRNTGADKCWSYFPIEGYEENRIYKSEDISLREVCLCNL